jgi:RNA polymerase sigma-70 factor (ECF subfamily)
MGGKSFTEGELLERWAGGSRDAGNELIERYFVTVHRFFRSKVGPECDDLVQQTFLACLEARLSYRGEATFKTFLLAIARNKLYRHYDQRRHAPVDFSISSVRDLGCSPSGVVSQQEHEQLIGRALQAIPLAAQTLLELAYYEDLSGPDIARVLEMPLNTVYSRLHRARNQLRDQVALLAPDAAVTLPPARIDREV